MYWDMHAEYSGNPSVFRCFSSGNDLYVAVILINDGYEDGFIGKFLDNIVVE